MRAIAGIFLLFALVPLAGLAAGAPDGDRAVVLVHHPLDDVDPFGVAFGRGDTFAARYVRLLDATGAFPYPVVVVDGVDPVLGLPRPEMPYQGTIDNYTATIERRLAHEAPVGLGVLAQTLNHQIVASLLVTPVAAIVDPSGTTELHLWAAVVEDQIYFTDEAPVWNGIENHRFTVRALQDTGAVDLGSAAPQARNATFAIGADWNRAHLSVAAWLQAGPTGGRFAGNEVVQAASAPVDGPGVVQKQKAALVEMYSATWCDPCYYGDLALEQIAIRYAGAAETAEPSGPKYFEWPEPGTFPGRMSGLLRNEPAAFMVLAVGLAAAGLAATGGFAAARRRGPPGIAPAASLVTGLAAFVLLDPLWDRLFGAALTELLGAPHLAPADWLLVLAALGAAGAVAVLAGAVRRSSPILEVTSRWLLTVAAIATAGAFLFLVGRFLATDLSYQYVFFYTGADLDWHWRLAGTWAGREGSLLLWTMLMAGVTALLAWTHRRGSGDEALDRARSWTQLFMAGGLLLFLLASLQDSPFAPTSANLLQGRPEGNGLTPTLKSAFILIHPPLMFLAYALSSVPAAAVLGHLASGTNRWSRVALTWSRSGWLIMTFALGLGAMWAYFTLGFGGYFAWDPVEVANLLPWLGFTVYLHAQLHHLRHGSYARLGPFLGVLPFLFTVFSAISTRSGLWVSVHAFTDPTDRFDPDGASRFLDILHFESSLGFYVGLFLALFAGFLALWSYRLSWETGRLRSLATVVAGVFGCFSVAALLAPATTFSVVLETSYRLTGLLADALRLASAAHALLAQPLYSVMGPVATGVRQTGLNASAGFCAALLTGGAAILAGRWWQRLAPDERLARGVAAAVTVLFAALALLALREPEAPGGTLWGAAAGLDDSVGIGLLIVTFAAVAVAAAPLWIATQPHEPSPRRGLQRINLRSLNAYAVVALGMALLVLFLFHMAAVNGWSTAFYEERFPYLAAPVLAGLMVLQGHQAYGRRRSLWIAGGILAAAALAQFTLRGHRAGPLLVVMALGLVVVSLDRVRRAGAAPGIGRTARIADLLLWLAAILDLLFWVAPPTLRFGAAALHVPFLVTLPMIVLAGLALWMATRILAGAAPRSPGWCYALVGLLAGFYIALPMAALAWWLRRGSPRGGTRGATTDPKVRARLRQVGLYGIHMAMAVAILGYGTSTYYTDKVDTELAVGESVALGGQTVTFDGAATGERGLTPLDTIVPRFTVHDSGQSIGELRGLLQWEKAAGAHYPLPATLHRWHGDIYLDVQAVHVGAGGMCLAPGDANGTWIEAYRAASTGRACAGDHIDAVRFKAVDLPGIALLWLALLLLVFHMCLLLFAEPKFAPRAAPNPET